MPVSAARHPHGTSSQARLSIEHLPRFATTLTADAGRSATANYATQPRSTSAYGSCAQNSATPKGVLRRLLLRRRTCDEALTGDAGRRGCGGGGVVCAMWGRLGYLAA
jgi:hypothetical protein